MQKSPFELSRIEIVAEKNEKEYLCVIAENAEEVNTISSDPYLSVKSIELRQVNESFKSVL